MHFLLVIISEGLSFLAKPLQSCTEKLSGCSFRNALLSGGAPQVKLGFGAFEGTSPRLALAMPRVMSNVSPIRLQHDLLLPSSSNGFDICTEKPHDSICTFQTHSAADSSEMDTGHTGRLAQPQSRVHWNRHQCLI